MSVILQKDKVTGETLVYETTNYRDKKTGKSGTRKELLGKLSTDSHAGNHKTSYAGDYETAVQLFDEAPHMMEDIDALTEHSFAATKAVGEMLDKKVGDDFSREEIVALFSKFSEVLEDKDKIFEKLSSFNKELIEKAACVVHENEILEEIRAAADDDKWNAQVEHVQLKTLQEQVDTCKNIIANYEELKAQYEKTIAGDKEVIDSGNKLIENGEMFTALQTKVMLDLIDRLSKHEDVSDLEKLKESCESILAKWEPADADDAGENT